MKKSLISHRVKSFKITAPYTVQIIFEDDHSREIDFQPVLGLGMYSPLRDLEFFNKVFISDSIATLTWPNGADFNPDHLYHWSDYKNLYLKRIKECTAL